MHKHYLLLSIVISFFNPSISFGYDIGVVNSNAVDSINCSADFSSLFADIENFGTQQVDSFYVYIDVNGSQFDTVLIIQNLPVGQQINVSLGNYLLTYNPSNIVTLTSGLPNGNVDTQISNDSYSINTYSRLSGSYTVGCLTCDFQTVDNAREHLINYGVCGPTTFNLVDGTYYSVQMSQFNLSPFTGMSSLNPVIFQSLSQDSSAVVLSPSVSPAIVLNSLEYVTFRNLTVDPQVGSIGFKLFSVSNFNIENCQIKNSQIQTAYGGGGPGFDSVRISNNYFYNGSISFNNNSFNVPNSNGLVEVTDNEFVNSYAVFIEFSQVVFVGNHISSPSIDEPIGFSGCSSAIISKNFMKNAKKGLRIGGCSMFDVTNNFLRGNGEVIYLSNSNNINIINNNLYQYDASIDYGEAVSVNSSTGVEFINNILFSEEHGSLVFCSDTSLWNPHHNIYYSPSDSLVRFGWNQDHITFQDWTVNLGKDSSSLNWNPNYDSPIDLHTTNLVMADSNAYPYPGITEDFDGDARNQAVYDIGADEFELDLNTLRDIALISINEPNPTSCSESDSMKLLVANYSTFQIDSFSVRRYFYGNFTDLVWNYTPIPAADTILVNIGAFNFSPNTSYEIELVLDHPNGLPDNYELNNNNNVFYQYLDSPNISIREVSDCSPEIELTVPNQLYDTLLWSTGDTIDQITVTPPGTWTVTITNQSGCIVNGTVTLN